MQRLLPEVQLSAAQRALWSSQRRHPGAALQNMALLTHIEGSIDPDRLGAAFRTVVEASSTLRLTIAAGSDVGRVVADAPSATEVIDLERVDAGRWAAERVASRRVA